MKISYHQLANIIYNITCQSSYKLYLQDIIEDLIEYLYENDDKLIEIQNPYIGIKLHGFCNGYFGRDSYDDKTIEYLGDNYIVVKDSEGNTLLANFNNKNEMKHYINQWSNEENI